MKDHRRDHTVAIPQSTLEELAESQRKLAKRESTLVGGAIVADDPRTPETSSSIVARYPRTPLRRDELETVLEEHLKLFPTACQEAFLRSFCARSYVAAISLLDEALALQPKNLSMAQAASAIRHFALGRLESDLGGLHAKVRAVDRLSTAELPRALADLVLHIDGVSSIESLLRRAPGTRLQALGLLADLARDDQIELLVSSPQRQVSLRLPPLAGGAAARVDSAPKGGSPRESGERKRVAEPRLETPVPVQAALSLPSDLAAPGDESTKERRLVTWSSTPESAGASGPFAVLSRQSPGEEPAGADALPADPSSLPAARERRARQSSAAPTPVVTEARAGRVVPADAGITSQRWFIPAVVGGVLALGGLVFALTRDTHTVPPPHPARTLSPSPLTTSDPAPTLQPPVPVVKQTADPQPAPTDVVGATMVFKIEVEPKYARVTLDGVLLTKAPIRVVIPKDGSDHEVRVESAGYHTRKMSFKADADVSMVIALDKATAPPRASAK